MVRLGFFLLLLAVIACNDKKKSDKTDGTDEMDYESFSEKFKKGSLPYQLTDTGFLNNEDTITLKNAAFTASIPDTIKTKLFGSVGKITYIPLVRLGEKKGEQYYILKAVSGKKKAALLAVFDKDENFAAALPFLIPDTDNKTTQVSSIDRSYSISRNVYRKMPDDVTVEGRDVYAYDNDTKSFSLIMTDVLDDRTQEVINPIDTFARSHRYAADYVKDKRNIVSIRNGRNENEINFFVHFERMEGECNGELKGTALLTSSKTAVYRQGGDPCVLEFHFTNSSVSLKEIEGCGSHRGVKCVIEGSFPKKKAPKTTNSSNNK